MVFYKTLLLLCPISYQHVVLEYETLQNVYKAMLKKGKLYLTWKLYFALLGRDFNAE